MNPLSTVEQYQQFRNPKKILALIVGGLFLLAAAFGVYGRLTATKITVESEEGATISISLVKGEPFEEIGKNKSSFSSSGAISIFVRAEKDGKITQRNVSIDDGAKEYIYLSLGETSEASRIADLSLSHIFIGSGYVLGINPTTRSLTGVLTNDSAKLPSFFNLPFVNNISWRDQNNFVFNSLRDGVGIYDKGKIANRLSFSDTSQIFGDFSQHPGKPLVLLAPDGIYMSNDFGQSTEKMANLDLTGVVRVFSDINHIFYVATVSPEAFEGVDIPHKTTIRIYDYSGNLAREHTIEKDIGNPIRLLDLGAQNKLALLTDKMLVFIDKNTGSTSEIDYHADSMEDMLLTQGGKLLLLGSDGLWNYDFDSQEYKLVNSLEEGEEYVVNSLSQIDNDIYYSVKLSNQALRNPNRTASNAIYKVSFE